MTPLEAIAQHCKQLRLSTIGQIIPEALTLAQQQEWSLESFLVYLLEQEISQRQQRRIERYLRQAHLPPGKTLAQFDQKRFTFTLTSPDTGTGARGVYQTGRQYFDLWSTGHRKNTFSRRPGL